VPIYLIVIHTTYLGTLEAVTGPPQASLKVPRRVILACERSSLHNPTRQTPPRIVHLEDLTHKYYAARRFLQPGGRLLAPRAVAPDPRIPFLPASHTAGRAGAPFLPQPGTSSGAEQRHLAHALPPKKHLGVSARQRDGLQRRCALVFNSFLAVPSLAGRGAWLLYLMRAGPSLGRISLLQMPSSILDSIVSGPPQGDVAPVPHVGPVSVGHDCDHLASRVILSWSLSRQCGR
jgi:hypothetical protein